jgi:flagellin
MIIQPNMTSGGAAPVAGSSRGRLAQSVARLGENVRVAGAAGDAAAGEVSAGLTVRMRQIQALQDGLGAAVTRVQTQWAYLDRAGAVLSRMAELGRQAADENLAADERVRVQAEFRGLARALGELAGKTFAGEPLFDGSDREVPVDAAGRTVRVVSPDLNRPVYGEVASADVGSVESAIEAVKRVETASTALQEGRDLLRAGEEGLRRAVEALRVEQDNLGAVTVRLRDVEAADAAMRWVGQRLLTRGDEALQAQANTRPETAVRLLS